MTRHHAADGIERRAIILLSGGLDSSTALAVAVEQGFTPYALSFRYGQRHERELEAARAIGRHFGCVEHKVIDLDLRGFGGSALTDTSIALPLDRDEEMLASGVPVTYVPARNLIFLSIATAYAEVTGANDIFLGINAIDYSIGGESQVWVRSGRQTQLMRIDELCSLPDGKYETISVDPATLTVGWRKVDQRNRHAVSHKRCFKITLERGQNIRVTEDHSLYTINPTDAQLIPIKGKDVRVGCPLVVPFDLSACVSAWEEDLAFLDLTEVAQHGDRHSERPQVVAVDGYLTNRLRITQIPARFPVTDDFLYIVGLWLAEGGKHNSSPATTLAFSIGGTPGAAECLRALLAPYKVTLTKSSANDFDFLVHSSVLCAIFRHFGLLGTAKQGDKAFPTFFWRLSQRQRRLVLAGLWDGDGGHVFNREALLAQKSHALVRDAYHCLTLDGIFPTLRPGKHSQLHLLLNRSQDFANFAHMYPLRHTSKRESLARAGEVNGKEKVTGLWKCDGLWFAVSQTQLPPGEKTIIYNSGGKYDSSVRAQRKAFARVERLAPLVKSRLAFLRVLAVEEIEEEYMYDLAVEGTENFVANGILAHNSGYPDCRPEFLNAFAEAARLATKAGTEDQRTLRFHAPLITLSKADIVRDGTRLGVPWELTWSCYAGGEQACGRCDSCQLRLKGFAEAGLSDPLPYAHIPQAGQ
jgi:7-cyano-7-deazaguanine synthase in queuosine biosynthesis